MSTTPDCSESSEMMLIERVFARDLRNHVATYRDLGLGGDVDVLEISDAVATFVGVDSPLTTVKGLSSDATVDQLGEIEGFFRAHGVPIMTVELAPWSDTATLELLAARGYVVSGTEDVVCCGPGQVADDSQDATLEVIPISADAMVEISRHGFGHAFDPAVERLLGVAARLPGSSRLGVRREDRVIACAQAALVEEAVIFGNDNTLPDARRLGAQAALIRARFAFVEEGAIAVAEVAPGSGSERNYVRCGFEVAYRRTHFSRVLD